MNTTGLGSGRMKKPTVAEIVQNYDFGQTVWLEDEDEMKCTLCGKRFTSPGTALHIWHRFPHKGTDLLRTVELCDSCNDKILELKAITQP